MLAQTSVLSLAYFMNIKPQVLRDMDSYIKIEYLTWILIRFMTVSAG